MSNTARFVSVFLSAGLVAPALANDAPRVMLAKFVRPAPATQKAPSAKKSALIQMKVAGVAATDAGPAVVLQDLAEKNMMPIWIGHAEAHAIRLRLAGERFQRPLTHDLLESVMKKLGGTLLKIHVEDLRNNTFIGRIFIQTKNGVVELDARPSDSIALALGSQAPIFVAAEVLRKAKLSAEEPAPKPKKRPSSDPFEPPAEIRTL